MRALVYAFLLWAWALCACCLSAPRAEDWLAVGFRTPEQTFRTFQTGLRAGMPELEYRCLGTDLKHRSAASLLAYAEFRRELFKKQPWLKLGAKARIKEVKPLRPDRVQLVAEVDTWIHDETFVIELVREEFYELYVGQDRVADDFADWRRIAREADGSLAVTVPLPANLRAADVGELRAGHEWKIDGFPLSSGAPEASP